MNRNATILILALSLTLGAFRNPAQGAQQVVSVAGNWSAMLDGTGTAVAVRLPGSADEQGLGKPNREVEMGTWSRRISQEGPIIYRRDIDIPQPWEGKRITLFLERTKVTKCRVDGKSIGSRDSLINPHRYDLTGLAPGRHSLEIQVNNDRSLLPPEMTKGVLESHQISSQTQTNWNGIIGRMELQCDEPVSFGRVNVYPDLAANRLRVRLETVNITGKATGGEFTLTIEPNAGAKLPCVSLPFTIGAESGPDSPAVIDADIPVPAGALAEWSELTPVLHRFVARLKSAGEAAADEQQVRFGWRAFGRRHSQFAINGKAVLLRGETENAVFPLTGYVPMNQAEFDRQIMVYKEFGINHLRFHSWSPPRCVFDAADAAGIYLAPELPAWTQIHGNWLGSDASRNYYTREAREYLLENGNSPAFVMLSLGNELIVNTRKELFDKEKDRLYGFLDDLRKLDPTRLYTEQTGWSAPNARNDYFNTFGLYNVGNVRSFYEQNTAFDLSEKVALNPELPLVVAEIGQYNVFPDAGREALKYTGVLEPRNLIEFNRRAAARGLARWIPEFERASCMHAEMLYAYECETYLRTPGMGGFQMLNIKDFPGQGTALCGLVDAFTDLKPGVDAAQFRRSCAPVTLLAKLPRLVWTSDQQFTGEILVANYSLEPLASQRVQWRLVESISKATLGKGEIIPRNVPQGAVTTIGSIDASLANARVPEPLELIIETPGLRIKGHLVDNRYRLWVYPPVDRVEVPAGILVASSLTARVREALAEGGTVLLFPSPNERILPRSIQGFFRFGFWWGAEPMGLLVDNSHPIFRSFPASSCNDFQWFNLLGTKQKPQSRGIIVTGLLPKDERPIVTMIPSYKNPELLSLLMEARVGKGKVLICSMNVMEQLDKPEVRQFYRALLGYAASAEFHPKNEIPMMQLRELIRDESVKVNTAKSNDSSLLYTGSWTPDGVDARKGTEKGRWTTEIGATVSWDFSGTGIVVTARRDKMGSSYDVFLDGNKAGRADLYEDNNDGVTEIVWSKQDLAPGKHAIRLVLSEDRHPGSMGPRGWIQKLESLGD